MIRATAAWLVAFALLFQMLVPVLAAKLHASATIADTVICANHIGDPSGDPDRSAPGEQDTNCCSVCALLQAAHLAVPPPASADLLVWPSRATQVQFFPTSPSIAAQAAHSYSSRAPPLAS